MKTRSQGFTLIELIIVIVILGILAVTASPRFLDLTGDARASTVQGLEGAIEGAASISNSKAIIQGQIGDTGSLDVESNDDASDNTTLTDNIDLVNGFPEAGELVRMLEGEADYTAVYNNADAANATIVRFYPEGVTPATAVTLAGGSDCYVTYTNAAANERPAINSETGDCSS